MTGSRLLPAIDVIDHGFNEGYVVFEDTDKHVAAVTEQVSDDTGVMAMINGEMAIGGISGSSADVADSTLIGQLDVVLSLGDAIGASEVAVTPVFFPPCSPSFEMPFSVLGSVSFLHGTPIGLAGPSVSILVDKQNVNKALTAQTPSPLGLGVDFSQTMLDSELSSTPPSSVAVTVELDGDGTTAVADSTTVFCVDVSQDMSVIPSGGPMAFHKEIRLSFDQSSGLGISGSDGSFQSAPTMTVTICDLAFRITTQTIVTHKRSISHVVSKRDGTSCSVHHSKSKKGG